MIQARPSMKAALMAALLACSLPGANDARAQEAFATPITATTALATISTLVQNEQYATDHRGRYLYLSVEKSDRTNGHTWTERVAETAWGKVRFLIAEDGKPITGERLASEKATLAKEAANPEAFKRQEEAHSDDELRARKMLRLLPEAYFFDPPVVEGDTIRVGFHPNPIYQPQGIEERVLHSMAGTVLIDARTMRLRGLDCKLPQDVSFGFGLATVRAGSFFDTMRVPAQGIDWKTDTLHTDFIGKALFLKTIARQQDSKHSDFKRLPNDITVAEAVKLLEE